VTISRSAGRSEGVFRPFRIVGQFVVDVDVDAVRNVPVVELVSVADIEDEDVLLVVAVPQPFTEFRPVIFLPSVLRNSGDSGIQEWCGT